MRFSRARVCMLLLDILFFKIAKIYESLQVLLLKKTLPSLNIPANVTYLTNEIGKCVHCYFCFTLRQSCKRVSLWSPHTKSQARSRHLFLKPDLGTKAKFA